MRSAMIGWVAAILAAVSGAVSAANVETLLVIESTEQFPRNSEGDLAVLRDGRIFLAYTRFNGGGADNASADIVARASADAGRTWSQDRVLVPNEGKENVMSVSIVRLASGEMLLFYLRKNGWNDLTMYVRRSSDEFETLSDPVRVSVAEGYHVVNNDRVIQLSTGRLIVPAALHPCPDGTQKTWSPRGIPRTFISDDLGATWRVGAAAPPPAGRTATLQEPGLLELKDGRLWMWMRTPHGFQYESFSSNGGVDWSEPAPSNLASPQSPASIQRVPWTGDLLCVWNDHSGWHAYPKGKRTPLCVALSSDEGKTWSKSRVIEGDPEGWYCYTAMTFTENAALLAYSAGDKQVGGLNRLKVTRLGRPWLYPEKE